MSVSLDQGEFGTTNVYVCRACKQTQFGPRVAYLDGVPVCPACRYEYLYESEAAQDDVDRRWAALLSRDESKP